METEQAVRRIRVVRRFRAQPLADDALFAILDAGRHAGSSKNLQRWHFIVVRERERLEALAAVGPFASHLAGGAAAIALVTPDPHAPDAPLSIAFDLGRAAQNMVLVAWARGLGSVPATVYDQELCRTILGYPDDQHCEYLLNFGYPAESSVASRPPRAGGRNELADVVYWERWAADT